MREPLAGVTPRLDASATPSSTTIAAVSASLLMLATPAPTQPLHAHLVLPHALKRRARHLAPARHREREDLHLHGQPFALVARPSPGLLHELCIDPESSSASNPPSTARSRVRAQQSTSRARVRSAMNATRRTSYPDRNARECGNLDHQLAALLVRQDRRGARQRAVHDVLDGDAERHPTVGRPAPKQRARLGCALRARPRARGAAAASPAADRLRAGRALVG